MNIQEVFNYVIDHGLYRPSGYMCVALRGVQLDVEELKCVDTEAIRQTINDDMMRQCERLGITQHEVITEKTLKGMSYFWILQSASLIQRGLALNSPNRGDLANNPDFLHHSYVMRNRLYRNWEMRDETIDFFLATLKVAENIFPK